MHTYTYTQPGRQVPVFFDPAQGTVRFVVEGVEADNIAIAVSYDPPHVMRQLWEPFDGGLAGWLPGPPTALRIDLKQACGPVFLTIEQENEGEGHDG